MTPKLQPVNPRQERRRLLAKTGRRLVSAMLRRTIGQHPWPDDRRNFLALLTGGERGLCPICGWHGAFLQHAGRRRQICLACGSRARHRTLALAVEEKFRLAAATGESLALHIAPEPCLAPLLRGYKVVTGDLEPGRAETALDLRCLPFAEGSFDLVLASHVLEHIVEYRQALAEIRRVLRPGGLAILPVPITAEKTVEFGFVDPQQNFHARECGPDFLDQYAGAGFELEVVDSHELPDPEAHALTTALNGQEVEHRIPFCRKPAATPAANAQDLTP